MGIPEMKKEIHDFIDHADERFLRLVYSMVENEQLEAGNNLFSTNNDDLITRAEKSLESISKGRVRDIRLFQKDVESWKKNQTIK